jgi:hypothetical protein
MSPFEEVKTAEGVPDMETENLDEILSAVATNWRTFSKMLPIVQGTVAKFGVKLDTLESVTLPSVEEKADNVQASLGSRPQDYNAPVRRLWDALPRSVPS